MSQTERWFGINSRLAPQADWGSTVVKQLHFGSPLTLLSYNCKCLRQMASNTPSEKPCCECYWSGLPITEEEQKAWLSTLLDLMSRKKKPTTKTKKDHNKTRSGAVYFSVGSKCFFPPSSSVLKMKTCFSLGFSHCFCLKSTEKENPWFRTGHYKNNSIKCMLLKMWEVEAHAL